MIFDLENDNEEVLPIHTWEVRSRDLRLVPGT